MTSILLLLIAAGAAGLPTPYLVALYVISAAWMIDREVLRRRYIRYLSLTFRQVIQELTKKSEDNVSEK